MMDLVFCGTPTFAVPTLERLVSAGFRVRLVVTQPDRASGRGLELAASPVKRAALELGSARRYSRRRSRTTQNFARILEQIAPQAIIVVGYGRIIPQWMIDLPRLGNINLHGSLLPKYRGAAPIQWAIAKGESVTGVTTMRIDAGLDTGDILLQAEEEIRPEDTALTLGPRLAADWCRADDPNVGRPGQGNSSTPATGRRESDAGSHPQERRWADRFLAHRDRSMESVARISAVAGGVHIVSRQDTAVACSRARAGSRLRSRRAISRSRTDGFCLASPMARLWKFANYRCEGKKRMSAADFINGYRPRSDEPLGATA